MSKVSKDMESKVPTAEMVELANKNEKLKLENQELKKQLKDTDEMMLLAHRMCWNLSRMRICTSQNQAFKSLPRFRKAIGEERAEKLEKDWRGVTVKKVD